MQMEPWVLRSMFPDNLCLNCGGLLGAWCRAGAQSVSPKVLTLPFEPLLFSSLLLLLLQGPTTLNKPDASHPHWATPGLSGSNWGHHLRFQITMTVTGHPALWAVLFLQKRYVEIQTPGP